MYDKRMGMGSTTGKPLGNRVFAMLFLSASVFIAHFLYLSFFGLYEDDFSFFPKYLDAGLSALGEVFALRLLPILSLDLGEHGRPLAAFFQEAAAIIGSNLAGLRGVYALAFLVQALSAFLSFVLLRKLMPPAMALAGALVFALFPADTLHPFLNAAFGVRPAVAFLLLALISYMNGRKLAPYAFALAALLSYESMFFPFLAAPLLLDSKWDRAFLKKLMIHGLITAGMLVAVMVVRSGSGEGRVAGMAGYAAQIPLREAQSVAIGLFVSVFYAFARAAKEVFLNLDAVMVASMLVIFAPLVYVLTREGSPESVALDHGERRAKFLKLMVAGLALISLSYATAFYELYKHLVSHGALYGRASRVHMPSAIGSAVFITAAFMYAREFLAGRRAERCLLAFFALMLSLLVGYGQLAQDDYKNGWEAQKKLWTTVLKSSPDLEDGTLIIVEREGIARTKYIDAHSWFGVPHALNYIYAFPQGWLEPPRMNYKDGSWLERDIRAGKDGLEIYLDRPHHYDSSPAGWEALPDGNVILFKADKSGNIRRFDGAVDIDGIKFSLKPIPRTLAPEPAWPKGVLYGELITPAEYIVGRRFDGLTQASFPFTGGAKAKDFSIEFWLNSSQRGLVEQSYTNTYPPMPGLVGSLRLDQFSDKKLVVTIEAEGNVDIPVVIDIDDVNGTTQWTHVEFDYETSSGDATLYVNGRLVKKAGAVKVFLKNRIILGKGYAERYWQGGIGDLRVSSIVRHRSDFDPYEVRVAKDANTLFLLDGEPLAFKNPGR
jgi:hypothetical protein